jgi:hypothetical protein
MNAQTQPQTQNTDTDTNTRILAPILLGLLMNSNPKGLYQSDAVCCLNLMQRYTHYENIAMMRSIVKYSGLKRDMDWVEEEYRFYGFV